MKKILSAIILLVTLCNTIVAQNERIDRLKSLISDANDTSRIKALAELGFEYAFINADTSRIYSRKALSQARDIGFERGQADAVNNLAISFDIQGEYDSALFYFLSALRIYESLGYKPGIARALNNCGIVFQNLDSIPKSLSYHLKSFELEEQLGDSTGMAYSMIHLGNLFTDLEKSDSALHFYERSIAILEALGDRDGLTYSYVGLGEFYLSKNPDLAIDYLQRARLIYEESGNQAGLANTYLLGGKAYLNKDPRSPKGREEFRETIAIARKIGAPQVEALALEGLTTWHEANGDLEQALAYFRKFKTLQDSIFNQQKAAEIARVEGQFQYESQQQEIGLLNAENKLQRQRSYLLGAGSVVLLILLGLLWVNYRGKEKANRLLAQTNKEIEKKNREIEIERNNATQATKAKANFLSVMSHEIRTPLNAIIGLTHLLIDYPEQGDRKKNLSSLKFSAENLLALINDILDYSKLEEGKAEIESIQFNLKEILDRTLDPFQFRASEKQIRLKAKYDADLPKIVTGDPTRFSQVLTNLLSNAIKFTDQGSVILDVEVLDDDQVQFSVIDTGIGIPANKIEAIFESFTQADEGVNRKFGGTGLGLAISRQLVEAMGSELKVESVEGKGAKFYFTLKLKSTSAATYQNRASGTRPKFTSMRGARVLLMEDNAVNVLVATQFMKSWDVEVDVAANGLEGLKLLDQERYDLVLMDLEMPEMDGFEATGHIRRNENEQIRHLPVIALTSSTSMAAKSKAREVGMNDFITKPFNPNELYKMLEKYVLDLDTDRVEV